MKKVFLKKEFPKRYFFKLQKINKPPEFPTI
jgi:hypothetical protein